MSAAEAWLMMSVRAQRYPMLARGSDAFTGAEIARLLGGLERGPFLMGMATQIFDLNVLGALEVCLYQRLHTFAARVRLKWPTVEHDGPIAREIAGIAVFEVLNELSQPCPLCHGRGYRIVDNNGTPCPSCGNQGGRKLTPRERARLIGMPWRGWRDPWPTRYEGVHWMAIEWRDQALGHLAQRLNLMRQAA